MRRARLRSGLPGFVPGWARLDLAWPDCVVCGQFTVSSWCFVYCFGVLVVYMYRAGLRAGPEWNWCIVYLVGMWRVVGVLH